MNDRVRNTQGLGQGGLVGTSPASRLCLPLLSVQSSQSGIWDSLGSWACHGAGVLAVNALMTSSPLRPTEGVILGKDGAQDPIFSGAT